MPKSIVCHITAVVDSRSVFFLSVAAALAGLGPVDLKAQDDRLCHEGSNPGAESHHLGAGAHLDLVRTSDTISDTPCSAIVRNDSGVILWQADGFPTSLDRWSGTDINNDGLPEVVIGFDRGGGNRCCWQYAVISLTPSFEVLAVLDFPPVQTASSPPPVTLQQTVPFYHLGPSMADAPIIVLVNRLEGTTLLNETRARCSEVLAEKEDPWANLGRHLRMLTSENLEASKKGLRAQNDLASIRKAIRSVAMQHLYCNQESEASRLLQVGWPTDSIAAELEILKRALAQRFENQ